MPLLLKKISDDLEYLKSSLDHIREKPLKMATDYFKSAILKIHDHQNIDALNLLQKSEYNATEGVHLATTFSSLLKCVQLKMMSATLIESAVNINGFLCFIPIECLPARKKSNIRDLLKEGLDTIITRAGKRSFFGKLSISLKRQNEIGKMLTLRWLI